MIRLHLFPRVNDVQISSPCAKVETYLRLTGVAYETVESWDLESAPKKKFPYIEDAGTVVPDSWFILRYLEHQQGHPLDGALEGDARMLGHALGKVLDESLYFALSYWRWADDEGFAIAKEAIFGELPPVEREAAAGGVRELARNVLYFQGFGRHRPEEVLELVEADLDCLERALEARAFLVADTPTTVDCSGYGVLEAMLSSPVSPRLADTARRRPALVAYLERMRARLD